MSTYAIGDIQGCFDELKALLELIQFGDLDKLWFCGDLVNRGPKSLETLRFIRGLGSQAVTVLGNHDLHLLAVHHGFAKAKRSDTLNAILTAPDRNELLAWLQQQPLIYTDTQLGFTMTHAGIPPAWSIKKAHRLAKECQNALRENPTNYFAHMYGNQPNTWSDSLQGPERLRVITNYFTRMRFCTPQSELEFASKGGLESQPDGFYPWFSLREQRFPNDKLVFGHWAALEGHTGTQQIHALDTGCVWGGALRALRLEDLSQTDIPSQQLNR